MNEFLEAIENHLLAVLILTIAIMYIVEEVKNQK